MGDNNEDEMIYGGDEISAVVLDIGSDTTRAGYAGEDTPKTVFNTSYASVPAADGSGQRFLHGNNVDLWRPHAVHANPIQDGLINDWDAASRVVDHAFRDRLRLESLEEHPFLVTEPSWNTKENREKMTELAFEQWKTPAYYSVDKSVMSAFSCGRGTALVVDAGHELTSVIPVYDGFVLRKAVQRQPSAGHLLSQVILDTIKTATPPTEVVPQYLVKSKEAVEPMQPPRATLHTNRLPNPSDPGCPTTPSYHQSQELRVMHEFKESVCEVYPGPWDEVAISQRPQRLFEFPNGYNSFYGGMRFALPELFYDPARFLPQKFASRPAPPTAAITTPHPYSALQSLPKLISNSLYQIDPDLHSGLLTNIIVTGGTSLMQGYVDRLAAEMGPLAGAMKVKIHAPPTPAERVFSSWLGGSILASLGTFHQLWIGKEEYEEVGVSIIHRRAGSK